MDDEREERRDGPALAGSTCTRCGRVAHPAEPYGCDRCGAPPAELAPTALAPTGTVRSSATVHRHRAPEPAVPFVVVEVVLDAGPVVRSLLVDAGRDGGAHDDAALRGARVVGTASGGRIAFTRVDGR